MTDARPKQIQEIEALLAERRKYEQWIAQLETRKESTPSHVYVKVHRDYTVRLDEAQQKLSSETGAVNALATELEAAVAAQTRQIGERADERAEAELRASVGEFAGKEWDKLRGKLDSAIADLSGERDALQRELDTLRALLGEAEAPASAVTKSGDVDDIAFLRSVLGRATPYSTTPPPPAAIVEAPSAPRAAPAPAPASAPAPRASVPVEKRPSVVQPGQPIAEAVTAPSPPRPSAISAAPPPLPPAPAPARTSEPVRAAAPAPAPAAAAPAPVRESAPAPESVPGAPRTSRITTPRYSGSVTAIPPAPKSTPEPPLNPLDARRSSAGPRGTDDAAPARPSGTFGQLTPRTSEAIKSLKCQECGTLNFPTEWYCERCGGELAAF